MNLMLLASVGAGCIRLCRVFFNAIWASHIRACAAPMPLAALYAHESVQMVVADE